MTQLVGRCIGCFHDFGTGPCGGCGAIAGPHDTPTVPLPGRPRPEPQLAADAAWAEDHGPITLMALGCDHPDCDTAPLTADVRADTRAQAFAGIRDHGRAQGWTVSDDAAWACCPAHGHPSEQPGLLGVPGPGDQ